MSKRNPMFVEVEEKRRDRFAAAALAGMLASTPMCDRTKVKKELWAVIAVTWADAMLKATRQKEEQP